MDEQGRVPLGDVSAGLFRDAPNLPYGLTTDADRLLAKFIALTQTADVIVVDLGETSRVEECANELGARAAAAARARVLPQVDGVLGRLLSHAPKERWAVLVLAPSLREAAAGERLAGLTPILLRRPDGKPGLLRSASTRRPGVVVNTDVPATILDYFGLGRPRLMVGRPMQSVPTPGDTFLAIQRKEQREIACETAREVTFRVFPAPAAMGLGAAALLLALGGRVRGRWPWLLARGWLLAMMWVPALTVAVGAADLPTREILLTVGLGSLLLALLGSLLTRGRAGYALPAFLTMGLLVVDSLRGGPWLEWSPLSYSPDAGARFYGIGDELSGALLGAALISAGAWLAAARLVSKSHRIVAAAGLLAITAFLGYPAFGANLGMGMGAAVGAAVFLLYLWRPRGRMREVVLMLLLCGIVAALAIAADLLRSEASSSHVGLFVQSVRADGWGVVLQVAVRKWLSNWMLMRTSGWVFVVLAAVAVFAATCLRRRGWSRDGGWLTRAALASLFGAAAAWAFNDSGIAAAALTLLYGAGAFAYVELGGAGPASEAAAVVEREAAGVGV